MRKKVEIIPAKESLKINFYLVIAFYILILLLLDPMVDYFLLANVNQSNLSFINELSEQKKYIIHVAYGLLRLFPMILFAWFGYRILMSARLPPARMHLPFSVPLQKGRNAKVIGLFIISLALLFIAQNIAYVTQQLTH